MTDYKLPEPEYLGWDYERLLVKPIKGYTEAQMQQAYQAGVEAARDDLTIAYMSGYHKGRDSMKVEAVKDVVDWMETYPAHDDTALLRQCLEALEKVAYPPYATSSHPIEKAITALRERLGEKA
jgi:hypothetical protein